MKLREMARNIQAIAALLALLATGVPALAESFASNNEPASCNTVFCPMHRGQARQGQAGKIDCNGQGGSGENNSSMRACDPTPNPVVGTAPFVLAVPFAMRYAANAEPMTILAPGFSPFSSSIPLTPPPRALPS
jgi:hypothetical protein